MDAAKDVVEERDEAAAERPRSREHGLILAGALFGLAVLVAFALWIHPDARGYGTHEQLGLPACKMMEWFGVPCPGCGVTTSVALAAHLQVLASIRNQPFGFLVALSLPLFALWAVRGQFSGRDLYLDLRKMPTRPWAISLTLIVALSWLYKIALVRSWIG